MPSTPRIARANEGDNVRRLDDPEPVIARLHWHSLGVAEDVRAWRVATSTTATQIEWLDVDGPRRDWIRSDDVRRPGEPHTGEVSSLPWVDSVPVKPDVRPGPPRPNNG